jgi:hypothetical protein
LRFGRNLCEEFDKPYLTVPIGSFSIGFFVVTTMFFTILGTALLMYGAALGPA